jgi:hypothetical protein
VAIGDGTNFCVMSAKFQVYRSVLVEIMHRNVSQSMSINL